tara:strand:+ start:380 stop:505 length:126 start_codon:yes stop_codon:yes gene_type:complete
MSKQELNARIEKVAKSTNQTKEQVAEKLFAKDHWTWFLVRS